MSEWHDNQKQQNTNFRKLLKERIESKNPRRELTTEETKRLSKLEGIADKLEVEKTCKTVSYKLGLAKTSTHR